MHVLLELSRIQQQLHVPQAKHRSRCNLLNLDAPPTTSSITRSLNSTARWLFDLCSLSVLHSRRNGTTISKHLEAMTTADWIIVGPKLGGHPDTARCTIALMGLGKIRGRTMLTNGTAGRARCIQDCPKRYAYVHCQFCTDQTSLTTFRSYSPRVYV